MYHQSWTLTHAHCNINLAVASTFTERTTQFLLFYTFNPYPVHSYTWLISWEVISTALDFQGCWEENIAFSSTRKENLKVEAHQTKEGIQVLGIINVFIYLYPMSLYIFKKILTKCHYFYSLYQKSYFGSFIIKTEIMCV